MIGREENIRCNSSIYKSAKIISFLFDGSVLVFPIFLTICFHTQDNISKGVVCFLISIFFTSILPYSFIVFLYKKGVINDLHLPRRKDRVLPIIVSLLSLLTGYLFLDMAAGSFFLIRHIFFIYIINLAIIGLITIWWKISFHASYVALFSVIFLYIYGTAALPALLLIPLIGWARVVMKRHTISQVIAGTFLTGTLSATTLYFKDYYRGLRLRSDVIIDIFRISFTGNMNISIILTAFFIVLANQFQRTQKRYRFFSGNRGVFFFIK